MAEYRGCSSWTLDDVSIRRMVAWAELGLAAILTYLCAGSAWEMSLRPTDPSFRYGEWSWLVFAMAAPMAAAFWICGVALYRNWRLHWKLHLLPLLIAAGISFFLCRN